MTRKLRDNVRYVIAVVAMTAGFGVAIVAAGGEAGAASSRLAAISGGQTITDGSTLVSPDGHYETVLASGILSERITGGRTLGSFGTSVPGSYAVLQPNGSLVIFGPSGEVDFDSGTTGTGCPTLVMQLDGNLVDYDTAAIWSSKTTQRGMAPGDVLSPGWSIYSAGDAYRLEMQTNGDLVLDNDSGTKIWSSGTSSAGAYAIFGTGGNFAVESTANKVLWQTKTSGNSHATLSLTTNGNLDLDSSAGASLWSSHSTGMAGTGAPFDVAMASSSAVACPGNVAAPTTTVVQTQTQTQVVTTTQTVLVPTTTVVTVAVPAPSRKVPRVDVKMTADFYYKGDSTFLHAIGIAKMPKGTELTATYNPHLRGHRAKRRRGTTGKTLRSLVKYLHGLTFRPGQTLNLDMTRKGYENEWATFTFRSGKLPLIRPAPSRR